MNLRADSLDDTSAIAGALAALARTGDLVVLAGEMGAGKTAFAQGFAAALGVTEPVTSPTYTLVHSYAADELTLFHADLYRLQHRAEVDDLAFDELLDAGVVLVEWGDVVDLGPHLQVALAPVEDARDGGTGPGEMSGAREIEISNSDPRWQVRWPRLIEALSPWAAR